MRTRLASRDRRYMPGCGADQYGVTAPSNNQLIKELMNTIGPAVYVDFARTVGAFGAGSSEGASAQERARLPEMTVSVEFSRADIPSRVCPTSNNTNRVFDYHLPSNERFWRDDEVCDVAYSWYLKRNSRSHIDVTD